MPRSRKEMIEEGRDCIRLMEAGLTLAAVAVRKGVSFNTAKAWVKAARGEAQAVERYKNSFKPRVFTGS